MKGATSKPKRGHGTARPDGFGRATAGYRVTGRVWIEKDGEPWLGWGRVVLLERIAERGSMLAAAKSMGMGYRHAWKLVEEMNRLAPAPLVKRTTGGTKGGGTDVTAAGHEAIAHFWQLVDAFQGWLDARAATPGAREAAKGARVASRR